MNIPRQFYGMNYISRLISNFQDEEMTNIPKLCFSEIHDVTEKPLGMKETWELGLSARRLSDMNKELIENRSVMLDGLAIAKGENLICKGYCPPYMEDNPHITNSTCKTVTAIAVMFAISEGLLSETDYVLSFFPEYESILTSKNVKQMTVEHLLTMTSMSKCTEVSAMVEKDWAKAFLLTDCYGEPGTQFIYNSMNTYMLAAIICRITRQSLLEYLRPRLLEPLGINHVTWELCPNGIERGGWGMHLSLEGMLKIGLFLANDGFYDGHQWIDPAYIRKMKDTKVSQDVDVLSTGYGYQLWHLPDGYYMLSGMYGQHVIIDERQKLVVATNAHNDKMFPDSVLTRTILDCMQDNMLYQPDKKLKEKALYKQFLFAFQEFCNGESLIRTTGILPNSIYRNTKQKESQRRLEELQNICNQFHKKRLHMKQGTFHLFPYMMRGMYQFPPYAVTDILWKVSNDTVLFCFVKEAAKKDKWESLRRIDTTTQKECDKMIMRAGLGFYHNQTIEIGPNHVSLSAKLYLSKDEDNNDVLQLHLVFPATGFSRKIKFFLYEERIGVECMEYPDMKAIVEQVVYGETALAGTAIDLTGKIPDGVKVLLDHKVEPCLDAMLI